MGSGAWTTSSYVNNLSTRGFKNAATLDAAARVDAFDSMDTHQVYTASHLHKDLDPYGVIRECCDSDEHPNTVPVIFALDVTGSMGPTARACAAQINEIITSLNKDYPDVQFMTMGIGDFACDEAPLQVTQFESDTRIFDQMMNIYFEGRGGGNSYESYTAAWYFALHQCKLDCWKRGKKGIIITMGDEPLNPYLPGRRLHSVTGGPSQDVGTHELYKEVCEKYDVYHLAINDPRNSYKHYFQSIDDSFGKLLGDHLIVSTINELPQKVAAIVASTNMETAETSVIRNENGEISW